MTAEDQSDYDRFKKMLDRLGKPVVMSAEAETSKIIRRRLFEWDLRVVTQDRRVLLSKDALSACNDYADWLLEHRQLIPSWFPVDDARKQFADTYPFHPIVLSVFEQDIDPAEVEFSDDMFILTAEQARTCIEPPALKYIEVRPERASVEPGKSLAFTFRSLDQHSQPGVPHRERELVSDRRRYHRRGCLPRRR